MKKTLIALFAATMIAASLPAYAAEHQHGDAQDQASVQCARDCDMLLKECARETDSIQKKIQKLQEAIKAQGADPQKADLLRALNAKLKESQELLQALNKPGR